MDTWQLLRIQRILEKIKTSGPVHQDFGICAHMPVEKPTTKNWLYDKFKTWPKFSGVLRYPVPGGLNAYHHTRSNLWDKNTEYGRLRWELLDHLIAEVNAELKERDKCGPLRIELLNFVIAEIQKKIRDDEAANTD